MSKLTDKEREILSGKNFVHVATINPDGSPQVTPMWVDVEGDLIVVNTARGRIKERNITRDPRVALSAYRESDPYDDIAVQGVVVEVTEQGAREHIEALSQKYLGKPYPWDDQNRIIFKIRKK